MEAIETPLQRAVRVAGNQSALARLLDVTPQAVQQWLDSGRAPALRCRDIEAAVDGAVTRYELRPDVFGQVSQSEIAA